MSGTAQQGWKPDGEAFCWQPKAVLRRIREAFDADNSVASAILVYVALSEVASDMLTPTFQTTHAYLAMRCGLSPRTVQQRVKDLVSIGAIGCTVPARREAATYTMIPDAQPLPNDTQSLPRDAQPLPNDTQRSKKAPLPTLEEYKKNSTEEKAKNLNKPVALTGDGSRTLELIERCREVFGDKEMKRPDCHRRWYDRARQNPGQLEKLLADVAQKHRESGLDNPAAFAEKLCKEVYQI